MYNQMDTGFRLAGESDVITAARMAFESYAPYIPIMGKIPPTIFEDFGKHIEHQNLWFLEHNKSAIGMVVLAPQNNYILLKSMCVIPAAQGQGWGQRLLKFGEERALQLGYPKMHLYTNSLMERNQEIYRRFGYSEIYRVPYEWGWRVHMEKNLTVDYSGFQQLANAFG